MYEIRLWLSKKGRIKFVSHLDMFRLMQRAVRRAQIPLWYTEGFNPHPYISFLLALSLGVEGEMEPVDLRIVGEITPEEIKNRLNDAFPEGLRCEAALPPEHKPAEIAFARYLTVLSKQEITVEELTEALNCGTLTTEKSGKSRGKKVMKTVNVSEHIKNYEIAEDDAHIYLTVVLPAGSTFNLNPIQLMEAVSGRLGRTVTPENTVRRRLLREDLSEFR